MEEEISMNIIGSNGETFRVSTSVGLTIVEFKDLLAEISWTGSNEHRLIYRGETLEDHRTLNSYGVQEGQAIYMEVAMPVFDEIEETPRSRTVGMPDMSQLISVISMMMQSLLSRPRYIKQIIGHDPQLESIFDSNPQLRDIMQNPGVEAFCRLTSPQMMQGTQMVQALAITDNVLFPLNEFSTAVRLLVKEVVNINPVFVTQASLLSSLPVDASSTDFVVCNSKSSDFPGGKFFEEFSRVLKPGGEIFVQQTSADAKETTKSSLERKLLVAGFSDIQVVQMAELQSFGIKAKKPTPEQ